MAYLISRGADVNWINNRHLSALDLAAQNGHHEVVALLLQQGADLDIGNSILFSVIAQKTEYPMVVKILIKHNLHRNIVDIFGSTPLVAALTMDHQQIAALLIQSDASLDGALQAAIAYKAPMRTINLLLDAGIEVNDRGQTGMSITAVIAAINNNRTDVMEKLIESGVSLDIDSQHLSVIQRGTLATLVEHDVVIPQNHAATLLKNALLFSYNPRLTTDFIVDMSAYGFVDSLPENALNEAFRKKNAGLIKFLLSTEESTLDTILPAILLESGETLLQGAIQQRCAKLAISLLKAGAVVGPQDAQALFTWAQESYDRVFLDLALTSLAHSDPRFGALKTMSDEAGVTISFTDLLARLQAYGNHNQPRLSLTI